MNRLIHTHTHKPIHAQVLEIIILRRDGLRGQAWVIMDDIQAATAAVQKENGFTFFGKDLKVSYAKETSDRIAKRDGTYVPKAKRQKLKQQKLEQQEAAQQAEVPPPPPPTTTDAQDVTGETAPAEGADAEGGPPPPPPTAENPSHILFAQDLPPECNEMMLGMLFRQYAGFKEVRIPREGLAFVEFESEPHATLAYKALNDFKLTQTDKLKLSYGKA